jgi:hypothetical protein
VYQLNGRQAYLVNHGATDPSNGCLGKNTGPTKDIDDTAKKITERYKLLQKSSQKNARKPTIYVSDMMQEDSKSKKTLLFHKE